MKKKVLVFLLVALVAVSSAFAARSIVGGRDKGSFSLGLNLGSNTGAIFNYGTDKYDIEGIIGFGVIQGKGLNIEVAASGVVVDVAKQLDFAGSMPFSIGLGADLGFRFNDPFSVYLGILAPLKLEYTFEDVPVSLYLRVAPGLGLLFAPNFDMFFDVSASVGATYNF